MDGAIGDPVMHSLLSCVMLPYIGSLVEIDLAAPVKYMAYKVLLISDYLVLSNRATKHLKLHYSKLILI